MNSAHSQRFTVHDLHPASGDLLTEILAGLRATPKHLPCKLFYDANGSELFEAICELDEYYPTRTELGLLEQYADEIATLAGQQVLLIEYGSGSSRKIRLLLDALRPAAYMPIDISRHALEEACQTLARAYPSLPLCPVCADYSRPMALPLPDGLADQRRLIFFPGSTIGNFTPVDAIDFLRTARELAGPQGGMLIGVDLKKDTAILNAAYNDVQGITAEFNLNLLRHLNRVLEANFDLDAFAHMAFYNEVEGRIEMHLVSQKAQQVTLQGQVISFAAGERVHTENSYKYTVAEFQHLAREAGFTPVQCWTDPAGLFSIHYLG